MHKKHDWPQINKHVKSKERQYFLNNVFVHTMKVPGVQNTTETDFIK